MDEGGRATGAEYVAPGATETPEQTTWGVGPWQGEWPADAGTPDEPNPDSLLDPELLLNGDTRNVLDQYRYWKMEAIIASLDQRRHKYHVAIENWQHDLNIGSIVRTANAFLAAEVHIIGNRRWNRRGAMVTDRYQHVRHTPRSKTLSSGARPRALMAHRCRSSQSTTFQVVKKSKSMRCQKTAFCSSVRRGRASAKPQSMPPRWFSKSLSSGQPAQLMLRLPPQ